MGCFFSFKMKYFTIVSLLLTGFATASKAQDAWYRENTPPRTFLIGAGPTFFGLNAKAGYFLKYNILIGASGELHELFSSRREAGVFGRKYLNSNRLSFFVQAGAAYGKYQAWGNWDIDNPEPSNPELYRSMKLNATAGGEIRFSKMVSIEGEAGYGRILNTNWWAPSIKSSINIRLNKVR